MINKKYFMGVDVCYKPGGENTLACIVMDENKNICCDHFASNRLDKEMSRREFEKQVNDLAEKYPSCMIMEEESLPKWKKLSFADELIYRRSIKEMEDVFKYMVKNFM